jgi:thioredoxin-related protein
MWKVLQAVVFALLISAVAAAQRPSKADDVLKEAKLKAVDSNKSIFLIFGASWCEACHQLDAFLAAPEMAAVFDKYFIIAKLSVGEAAAGHPSWDNPGSDALMMKYGGVSKSGEVGLPFIAVLDHKAKLIVNSNIPGQRESDASSSAGFASEPEEIVWFLGMVKKGAPAITEDETHEIREALQQAAARTARRSAPGDKAFVGNFVTARASRNKRTSCSFFKPFRVVMY